MSMETDSKAPTPGPRRVELGGFKLEYDDLPAFAPGRPTLLLMHEGLGSVQHWREFPATLAQATGCRCVAYSRLGHGCSSPRRHPHTANFVHEEAHQMLPALRQALDIADPVLIGHSTGASMALIHAGARRWPVAGVVALAPITFVEESNLQSIRRVRDQYPASRLRESLARYHDDVDAVFYGWTDTWLDPAFRHWTLLPSLAGIECPILAIRGQDDEYVTPAQIDCIVQHAGHAASVQAITLPDCGHAPHRDQPDAVVQAICTLLGRVAVPAARQH